MFNNLSDFSYKRTFVESIGFYLAFLLLGCILGGLVGGFAGIAVGAGKASKAGLFSGWIASIIFCSFLSFRILQKKNLLSNYGSILLALTSILLAFIGGSLLGLIPISSLSTFNKKL